MLRLLSLLSFVDYCLAQLRPPVLTVAPARTVPVFTIGSIEPIRTIGTTLQNITTTTSTQTETPENTEEINSNLFYIIIPSSLLLILSFVYLKKKKRSVNVVNIDLNIENKIPIQEIKRKSSNLSNHFYEEVNYEAMYEMPDAQNVKYENIIEENEYGKQVFKTV